MRQATSKHLFIPSLKQTKTGDDLRRERDDCCSSATYPDGLNSHILCNVFSAI